MLHAAAARHAARLKHSSLEHKLPMMLHTPALEHAASTKKVVDFIHAEFGKVRQLPSAVRRVSLKTYQTSKRQTIQTRYLTATVRRLSKHASMRFFTTSVSETSRQASIRPATRHPTIGYLTPSYIPYLTTNFHHIHPSPMSHFLLLRWSLLPLIYYTTTHHAIPFDNHRPLKTLRHVFGKKIHTLMKSELLARKPRRSPEGLRLRGSPQMQGLGRVEQRTNSGG